MTVSWDEAGGDVGLVQDVTGNLDPEILRQLYRQRNEAEMPRHVDRMRRRLHEEETA